MKWRCYHESSRADNSDCKPILPNEQQKLLWASRQASKGNQILTIVLFLMNQSSASALAQAVSGLMQQKEDFYVRSVGHKWDDRGEIRAYAWTDERL